MPNASPTARFAENLSRYFEAAEISQEALASRAGIHRTQVGELLRGKQNPRLETVIKLAGALGIDPALLIEGIRWEPAATTGRFKISRPKK